MKNLKQILGVLLLLHTAIHAVNEFRTPLSFRNKGHHHYATIPMQNGHWYDKMPCPREHCDLQWNMFSSTYYRSAGKAFFNVEKNKNTRKTTELATLFFGKESFRGEEVFVDGIIKNNPGLLERINPFLGFARITPKFDYNERGAFVGANIDYSFGCEGIWHVGGRASIPFKVIEIEQHANLKLEETLEDVVRFRPVNLDEGGTGNRNEFAARYDFLSSLSFNANNDIVSFIRYNNAAPNVQIGGQNVSGANSSSVAAYVTKNSSGEFPVAPFKKTAAQVTTALGANGEGSDGGTFFLRDGVDYANNLACNRDAQGTLFVVPRATDDSTNITDNANAIRSNIAGLLFNSFVISGNGESALEFFRTKGINLTAHERVSAIGDAELETYIGYGYRDSWYVDGVVGVRLPTGKKKDADDSPYYMSTGHNRHTEVKLGFEGGWMPFYCMGLKVDGSYHHAFKRSEKRALAFKGATVKNIGQQVDVDVSWDYFIGHLDATFFHPWNTEIGATLGYEIFAKRKDTVSFKSGTTAKDLLGRTNQALDAKLLEARTNTMSHKVRGQVFHRWNLFELFAGASHVFAGKNVMKESEAHVGFGIYF